MHELAEYSPLSVIYYRWGYSWKEILNLYKAKQKSYYLKRSADYEFLISLTTSALGGKSESKDSIGQDDGSGIDEMSIEKFNDMKEMLGTDFIAMYGDWEELPA